MKPHTLRFTIATLVSGLLLTSITAIGTAHYLGAKRVIYLTTQELMGQIAQAMNDKLAQRLHSMEKMNTLIADVIRSGNVDLGQEGQVAGFLKDVLEANASIAQIDCGLPSGNRFQARRMADGTLSTRINHRTATQVSTTWQHQNPAYGAANPDSVAPATEANDPRTRTWYRAALQSGQRTWAEMHPNRAGLNYANVNPVFDAGGRLLCVTSIDVNMGDLSVFLNRFKFREAGKAFILDQGGHVVAMSMASLQGLEQIMKPSVAGETGFALRDPGDLPDPDIRASVQAFARAPQQGGQGFLAFRNAQGRRLLAAFHPDPRYQFTFGFVLPEDSMLGDIKHTLNETLALAAGFLALSLVAAWWISRSISRPLVILAQEVDRIRTLDLGDAPAISTSILEVVLIDQSIQNMRKGLRSFRKYVPADLVVQLMRLQKEAVIEGEKRELTLFFSDIADFTTLAEQLGPEALLLMLGTYFGDVTRILVEHSGTVDKFIGDAVMAFWGAPSPLARHAELACRAALAAQARIQELNRAWVDQGGVPFHTRIGIHTGEATVGNIGYADRMNYTVIGDSVNLASRLEGLNKYYGTRILVSGATLAAAGPALLARRVDRVAVKGRAGALDLYELLGLRAESSPERLEAVQRRAEAFGHYQQRHWAEALALLAGESDGPGRILADRCRAFQAVAPEAGWDGVHRHDEK